MLIANKIACDNDIVELFHGEQVLDVSSRSLSSISGCCSSNSLFQTAKQNHYEKRISELVQEYRTKIRTFTLTYL